MYLATYHIILSIVNRSSMRFPLLILTKIIIIIIIFPFEQVLDRGERIELLVDKTENLQFQVTILIFLHE